MSYQLLNNSIQDQLRVEGINSKGMGQLAKFVMCCADIEVKAKLIYACLVSHCGQENTSFPGRDLIVKEVGINRQTYDKYMKTLKDSGLIKVTKSISENGTFTHNVYTISFLPDLLKGKKEYSNGGVYSDGWGLIPNLIFRDDRLSWKAKLIYSYLTVYADHKTHKCNPSPSLIQKELNVYNHWCTGIFNDLIKAGYIEKVQTTAAGRFSGNEYLLIQNPKETEEVLPHVAFSSTVNSSVDNPSMDKPSEDKPSTGKPSSNKRNLNNTSLNNIKSINPSKQEPEKKEGQMDPMDYDQIMEYRKEKGILPFAAIIKDDETKYAFAKGIFAAAPVYLNKGAETVMNTMFNCLMDLLEEKSVLTVNGVNIGPSKVLSYIDRLYETESDFGSVLGATKCDFERAQKSGMIRSQNYAGYIKTCLFNNIKNGELKEEADMLRDFGEYDDRPSRAGKEFQKKYEGFLESRKR